MKNGPKIVSPSETCKEYLKPWSEELQYPNAPAAQIGLNANVINTTSGNKS